MTYVSDVTTNTANLVATILRIRTQPVPPNEESAKLHVIFPVLRDLGWDSSDFRRVKVEQAAGKGRVDVALWDEGRFVAFLETKAPGKDLDQHIAQVLGYAFHEGVDICVLTTGYEWWLYLPREKGSPQARRFARLDLRDGLPEVRAEELERFLSRSALVGGAAEAHAKQALRKVARRTRLKREVPKIWEKMWSTPDPDFLGLITKRVGEITGLDPTQAEIAAALGMKEPADGPPPVPDLDRKSTPQRQSTPQPRPNFRKRPAHKYMAC